MLVWHVLLAVTTLSADSIDSLPSTLCLQPCMPSASAYKMVQVLMCSLFSLIESQKQPVRKSLQCLLALIGIAKALSQKILAVWLLSLSRQSPWAMDSQKAQITVQLMRRWLILKISSPLPRLANWWVNCSAICTLTHSQRTVKYSHPSCQSRDYTVNYICFLCLWYHFTFLWVIIVIKHVLWSLEEMLFPHGVWIFLDLWVVLQNILRMSRRYAVLSGGTLTQFSSVY